MECKACGVCKEPYEKAGEVKGRPSLRVSEGSRGPVGRLGTRVPTPLPWPAMLWIAGDDPYAVSWLTSGGAFVCKGTESSFMGAMMNRCFTV